jgi:primase-polymerase (primpol)-like protein
MSQFNQAPLIAKSIPNLLKSQNTWVVWKYGPANLQGKRPKIPLSPKTLSNANALDPVNHLSFGEALTIYLEKKSDGVGITLTGRPILENSEGKFYLIALDLDGHMLNSLETQEIWTAAGKPYREISPSGKGVRMFALSRELYRGGNARNGREFYCSGRYVTVTGDSALGEISDKTEQLNDIHDQWFMKMHQRLMFNHKKKYSEPETPRQIARIENMLSYISADCDYTTYRNIIWAILSTGWECAEVLCLEWSKSCPSRFDEKTLSTLIKSFSIERNQKPTIATIVYLAKEGGWND